MAPWIGSSPNQTASRTDGTRTGSSVFADQKTANVKIRADFLDVHANDIVDMIDDCLKKDGGNFASDIDINGNKFLDVEDAAARNQFAAAGQVADGELNYAGTSSGTNTITASLSPAITAYVTGMKIRFKAGGTNTGAATFNANSVGAVNLRKGADGGTALAANDIVTGGMYDIEHDGTNFQLLNPGTQNVTITSAGAALLDDASASAQRTTLGLVIGTDVQAFDADTLKADTADTLTVGFNSDGHNAGTKSSGTFTPDPADNNFQHAVNGGAHTLAPPSSTCSIVIQYTNNASAGTITTSGFTKVTGDSFTTTNGHDFLCYIVRNNSFSHLHVVALQ